MLFEKAQLEKKEAEKLNSMPPWRQELLLRKKEQERLDKLPKWQKDLIVKKKVAHTKATFENSAKSGSTSAPWSNISLKKTHKNF